MNHLNQAYFLSPEPAESVKIEGLVTGITPGANIVSAARAAEQQSARKQSGSQ